VGQKVADETYYVVRSIGNINCPFRHTTIQIFEIVPSKRSISLTSHRSDEDCLILVEIFEDNKKIPKFRWVKHYYHRGEWGYMKRKIDWGKKERCFSLITVLNRFQSIWHSCFILPRFSHTYTQNQKWEK
jgi:hypothetical protein